MVYKAVLHRKTALLFVDDSNIIIKYIIITLTEETMKWKKLEYDLHQALQGIYI